MSEQTSTPQVNMSKDMGTSYYTVLTIAGSDSSGGAGIQADIKSISACGGYAASVITASTAQNTQGIRGIYPLPVAHVVKQLEAVLNDIIFGAIKIGMLYSDEIIQAVQQTLKQYHVKNIVLDPVMIATSGDKLMNDEAIESLKAFLPHVTLITPNIPEAEFLLGECIVVDNMRVSAKKLAEIYQTSVLLKGGHLELSEKMTDVLYNYTTQETTVIHNPLVKTHNTHGTGCTLSSSIATFLSKGYTLEVATNKGCAYLNKAIFNGKEKIIGRGHGAVNHFGV